MADEAFYGDARTIGNGDCEARAENLLRSAFRSRTPPQDEAHEERAAARRPREFLTRRPQVVNLACSLRRGRWARPLARRAQDLLRRYVVVEQFAAVIMPGGEDVDRYVVKKGSHLFAHAYVMFLPAAWVASALQLGGGGARLADPPPTAAAAETLVQDGISLFAAQPLAPFVAVRTGLRYSEAARVQAPTRIGDGYYKLLSSCMVVDGSVVSADGAPVYELAYSTGERYGAEFVDVVKQSPAVALRPTCVLAPRELAFARRCARYLHPVAPFDCGAPEPSLALFRRVVGDGRRLVRIADFPGPEYEREFIVQAADALDERFLRALRDDRMPVGVDVAYRLDFFAAGCFSLQVYVK